MSPAFESYVRQASVVGYSPMQDEPGYEAFLSANGIPPSDFLIPASKEILPEETARMLREKYASKSVAIFMPGRRFDASGTRHGRGHGWYDRLLAGVPEEWLRVGVLSPELLSVEPLQRESWDQPVDILLVVDSGSFKVLETKAREGVVQST